MIKRAQLFLLLLIAGVISVSAADEQTYLATDVLIAMVKKELQLKISLYTCLQILSVSVFEKTQVSCALRGDDYESNPLPCANQLILFDF